MECRKKSWVFSIMTSSSISLTLMSKKWDDPRVRPSLRQNICKHSQIEVQVYAVQLKILSSSFLKHVSFGKHLLQHSCLSCMWSKWKLVAVDLVAQTNRWSIVSHIQDGSQRRAQGKASVNSVGRSQCLWTWQLDQQCPDWAWWHNRLAWSSNSILVWSCCVSQFSNYCHGSSDVMNHSNNLGECFLAVWDTGTKLFVNLILRLLVHGQYEVIPTKAEQLWATWCMFKHALGVMSNMVSLSCLTWWS